MNEILETKRLILRPITTDDLKDFFVLLADKKTNIYLPWFPIRSIDEPTKFYKDRFDQSRDINKWNLGVCLKKENKVIGYLTVKNDAVHDFGYALLSDFWNQGIITEASKFIVSKFKEDGIPFITATHDITNPRSGRVMEKIGMKYCYTYKKFWRPKNIEAYFKMYQLNLNDSNAPIYKKYWNESTEKFL